jgi:hypothetical protein
MRGTIDVGLRHHARRHVAGDPTARTARTVADAHDLGGVHGRRRPPQPLGGDGVG